MILATRMITDVSLPQWSSTAMTSKQMRTLEDSCYILSGSGQMDTSAIGFSSGAFSESFKSTTSIDPKSRRRAFGLSEPIGLPNRYKAMETWTTPFLSLSYSFLADNEIQLTGTGHGLTLTILNSSLASPEHYEESCLNGNNYLLVGRIIVLKSVGKLWQALYSYVIVAI